MEKGLKNNRKIILHLCADIGSDSKPYYERPDEYDVRMVGSDIGVENYKPPKNVYGIIANPPCTEFSTATYRVKRDTQKGLLLVCACRNIIRKCNPHFWLLENPATGRLKDFLLAPRLTYQPWEYGSPWTKKTALWGNFNIPNKKYTKWDDVEKIDSLYIRPGRGKPSLAFLHKNDKSKIKEFDKFDVNTDADFRSLCSQKFAQAFFEVNK